jgi:hypothetical protein
MMHGQTNINITGVQLFIKVLFRHLDYLDSLNVKDMRPTDEPG